MNAENKNPATDSSLMLLQEVPKKGRRINAKAFKEQVRQEMIDANRAAIMPHLMADLTIRFYCWARKNSYFADSKCFHPFCRLINDETKAILVNRYCLIAITAWQHKLTLARAITCYFNNTLPSLIVDMPVHELLPYWCEQAALKNGYTIEQIYLHLKDCRWLPSDFQVNQVQGDQQ